jgi:hypothetical protein
VYNGMLEIMDNLDRLHVEIYHHCWMLVVMIRTLDGWKNKWCGYLEYWGRLSLILNVSGVFLYKIYRSGK